MELKEALDRLGQLEHTLYAYRYAMGVMSYDSETAAPELAAEGRGEALGTLSEVEYQLTAGPETGLLLEALEQHKEQLTTQQAAQLRVLKKQYDMYSKVPAAEVVVHQAAEQIRRGVAQGQKRERFCRLCPLPGAAGGDQQAVCRLFCPR